MTPVIVVARAATCVKIRVIVWFKLLIAITPFFWVVKISSRDAMAASY
jgi:hypothetical protein